MVWTGTSSNQTNRATVGILANDNQGNRKTVAFSTVIVWAAESGPTAPLFYVPKGFSPLQYFIDSEALSASAGVGLSVDFGDSGDNDRIGIDFDLDAAASLQGIRIATAKGYTYTADTLLNFYVTGTPVVSRVTIVTLIGTVPF